MKIGYMNADKLSTEDKYRVMATLSQVGCEFTIGRDFYEPLDTALRFLKDGDGTLVIPEYSVLGDTPDEVSNARQKIKDFGIKLEILNGLVSDEEMRRIFKKGANRFQKRLNKMQREIENEHDSSTPWLQYGTFAIAAILIIIYIF